MNQLLGRKLTPSQPRPGYSFGGSFNFCYETKGNIICQETGQLFSILRVSDTCFLKTHKPPE